MSFYIIEVTSFFCETKQRRRREVRAGRVWLFLKVEKERVGGINKRGTAREREISSECIRESNYAAKLKNKKSLLRQLMKPASQ